LGLLIDEGKADLETLSKDYIPAMEEYYSDVTLRHFTTLTSGYNAAIEPGNNAFSIPLPPLRAPGEAFCYSEAGIDQFAHTLTRIANEPLAAYFKRKIADEIKMDESRWFWSIKVEIDGYKINGGKGLHASSKQLARIGHLFLNQGRWNGRQLISDEWISEATKVQVPAPMSCPAGLNLSGRYGYNWWVNGMGQDGLKTWPHAPDATYCMMGHKYNALFVIPEWNMVIARVGDNGVFEMYYGPSSPWDVFLEKMGEAIIE
jgi:CubicO group peptidase (beta-lactamase class C family)